MSEELFEMAHWDESPVTIDQTQARLTGVKVLGFRSRNGREYPPATLSRAVALYEGAKVNINHPSPAEQTPRDYRDRFGSLTAVRFDPERGIFADLLFNPKHPLAEQLLWDAVHAPRQVGLSHHVLARTEQTDGGTVVTEISRVLSVDLVADPATTDGLFEAREKTALDPTELLNEERRLRATAEARADRLERELLIRRVLEGTGLTLGPDGKANELLDESLVAALFAATDESAVRTLIVGRCRLLEAARQWVPPGGRPIAREARRDSAVPLTPRAAGRAFAAAIKA